MEVLSCSSLGQFVESGALQAKSLVDINHDTPTNYGLKINGQKIPDNGEDDPESETDEACRVFKNSHVTVNTIECENNGESSVVGSMVYEKDESIALWAKWRGKWQAGIKCKRADWPLDVMKAKPTNDRKAYVVMFFPHARNYSWVDTLLVRPINELPDPIVHASHEVGIQLVQDLAVAQRFIMQKLTVGILDIVDRLNFQALVETSANINALKEFAMEAPRCKGYPDLGRMLMKLQKMFLVRYIDGSWLQCSFTSWINQCQTAPSAESIENLREELVSSILWKEINALRAPQWLQEQGSEWKMWKQEVIKLFSSSNLVLCIQRPEQTINAVIDHKGIGSPFLASSQGSRKRPKLEVRRAEPHTPLVENNGHCDSDPNTDSARSRDFESRSVNEEGQMKATGIKSSRCKAFIEAKGRQCVRWASEGDEYCCVHQVSRDNVKAVVPFQPSVELPICGGTTILGTRCKHHALPGSSFCKKHGPRDGIKRKREELGSTSRNMEIVLRDEAEKPLEVEPLSMRIATHDLGSTETAFCIVGHRCLASPKRHLLYCEDHVPSWLKRARNGKSRIITKEVFLDLLKDCSSQDQRVRLHQACEIFFKLFKSILSPRNQVPMEIQFQWAMNEASKDSRVATFLMKLVSSEKERIQRIWGLGTGEDKRPSNASEQPSATQEELVDDWIGYACSICLDSFRNRKVLETHVQDRHHAEFSEHCMLFQCIHCSGNFGNSDDLRLHVRSSHEGEDIRRSNSSVKPAAAQSSKEDVGAVRKYVCKFCPLKFDLLPDLGRHHQAAHMGPIEASSNPTKKAYRLKSGRLTRPNFKRALEGVPNGQINKVAMGLKKRPQASYPHADAKRLTEPECLDIAKALHSKTQTAIARPSDHEILKAARSCCCKVSLQASLREKYAVLPEKLYLRAAKLCSEHNVRIFWHLEGFICPNGCRAPKDQNVLSALTPMQRERVISRIAHRVDDLAKQWEKDEHHCVINPDDLGLNRFQTTIILCDDVSFGKESVPIRCIIDKHMLGSLHVPNVGFDGQATYLPWESFSYITKPLLHPSLNVDTQTQGSYMACGCSGSACSAETCDHVYLFNTDYEDAKDMNGKPMIGRFPCDGNGQLVLEDNYAIYECNDFCNCTENCPNRILQKGVQVKLEVFKTLKKGWALRATEPISRGKFVCEFIGEVVDEQDANRRRERYGLQNYGYLYNLGSSINKLTQLEERISCVIDTSKHGNVSRFVNHSCAPNLVSRVVIVESMDYRLAHIGLYTNRDIAAGEELTRDYGRELQPGSCYCRSSSCRGRVI